MLAYSRDEVAAPLRLVAKMLADVRRGVFNPDVTRSGLWAASGTEGDKTASASSSESSDETATGTRTDGDNPSEPSDIEVDDDLGATPAAGMVLNTKTKILHIDGGDGEKVKCGKPIPKIVEFSQGWPTVDFKQCGKCFV